MKKLLMIMLMAAGLPSIVSVNAQEANDDCLNFYTNVEDAVDVVCIATSKAAYDDQSKAIGCVGYPIDNIDMGLPSEGTVTYKVDENTTFTWNAGKIMFTILSKPNGNENGKVAVGGSFNVKNTYIYIRNTSWPAFYVGAPTNTYSAFNDLKDVGDIWIPAKIYIPDGDHKGTYDVTKIGNDLMKYTNWGDANNKKTLYLPSTIEQVGDRAFEIMRNYGDPSGPCGLSNIVFYDATDKSKTGDMYNNISEIGEYAFYDSDYSCLTSFPLGSKLREIGKSAFAYNTVEKIEIPSSVETIGSDAFCSSKNITTITIPESVSIIGENLFLGSENLTSATIKAKLTKLPDALFAKCWKLNSVTLSEDNQLEEIGASCFATCAFTSLSFLPGSLKKIGDDAFSGNAIAGEFVITDDMKNNLEYIGVDAFSYNQISYLKLEAADKYNNNFTISAGAFTNQQSAFTVEFSDECTTVPTYFAEPQNNWQSPIPFSIDKFDGGYESANVLRVIVPMGCIKEYMKHDMMKLIDFADYRVKFKWGTYDAADKDKSLSESSYFNLYNITPQQRLIATAAWENDILDFRPTKYEEKGNVPKWRVRGKRTGTDPNREKCYYWWYNNTVDYWDNEKHKATPLPEEPDFFEEKTSDKGFAFNAENFKDWKATEEAKNDNSYPQSLMPYTIHSYHSNSAYDNIHRLLRRSVDDGVVPSREGVVIDFPKPGYYLVPPAVEMANLKMARHNISDDHIDWENMEYVDVSNDTKTYSFYIDFANGQKEYDEESQNNVIKYTKYTFDDYQKPMLKQMTEIIQDSEIKPEQIKSEEAFSEQEKEYGQVWYDIHLHGFPDFDELRNHFTQNQNQEGDHNIIIGITKPTTVYPYWKTSPYLYDYKDDERATYFEDADDYLSFKASTYGIIGTGGTPDTFVNAFTHKDANGNDAEMSNDIMYVNFVFSKGYFVQLKTNLEIPANRAYFSAHADLTELFEEGKLENNSMMAIYREGGDTTEPTGVVTIDADRTIPLDNTYYTIDGRRINGTPTTKGIYIINGRKEIIR